MSLLTACRRRGPSVPKNVGCALKFPDETLTSALPPQHPGVLDDTKTSHSLTSPQPHQDCADARTGVRAGAGTVIRARDTAPMRERILASTYPLIWLASLRFADAKIAFDIWSSASAVCGIASDSEIQSQPVIDRAAPLDGLGLPNMRWGDPAFLLRDSRPPIEWSRRSLFYHVSSAWVVDHSLPTPSEMVLKTIRMIAGELWCVHVKLAAHSARNPPPLPHRAR